MNLEISQRLRQPNVLTATLFAAVLGSGALLWVVNNVPSRPTGVPSVNSDNRGVPTLPEPQLFRPLLPEQAKMENEKLPFSTAMIEKALPLTLPASELLPIAKRNATDCLTSAIYYEAGNELTQGKRAVAQVILNRARHPAYPKTICGVIYQGSERKTGCQFTFTCDGSLARRPERGRWEQARMIAIGAISGAVEPSVGMSTHYHANYVLPYWASSLDKVSQIGAHIFYRWKGSWGRRKAFSQAVQPDSEMLPVVTNAAIDPTAEDKPTVGSEPPALATRIIADEVSSTGLITKTAKISGPEISNIQADQKRSALAIDEKPSTLKLN